MKGLEQVHSHARRPDGWESKRARRHRVKGREAPQALVRSWRDFFFIDRFYFFRPVFSLEKIAQSMESSLISLYPPPVSLIINVLHGCGPFVTTEGPILVHCY